MSRGSYLLFLSLLIVSLVFVTSKKITERGHPGARTIRRTLTLAAPKKTGISGSHPTGSHSTDMTATHPPCIDECTEIFILECDDNKTKTSSKKVQHQYGHTENEDENKWGMDKFQHRAEYTAGFHGSHYKFGNWDWDGDRNEDDEECDEDHEVEHTRTKKFKKSKKDNHDDDDCDDEDSIELNGDEHHGKKDKDDDDKTHKEILKLKKLLKLYKAHHDQHHEFEHKKKHWQNKKNKHKKQKKQRKHYNDDEDCDDDDHHEKKHSKKDDEHHGKQEEHEDRAGFLDKEVHKESYTLEDHHDD